MKKYNLISSELKSSFEHRNDIDDFLKNSEFEPYHRINWYILNRFLKIREHNTRRKRGFWHELNFFNKLYDHIDFIKRNFNHVRIPVTHLRDIKLYDLEKNVLLSSILIFFKHFKFQVPIDGDDNIIDDFRVLYDSCIWEIYKEFRNDYQSLNDKIPPEYRFEGKRLFEKERFFVAIEHVEYGPLIVSNRSDADSKANDIKLCETVINFFKELREKGFIPVGRTKSNSPKALKLIHYALFIYYLQETGYFPHFEIVKGGIVQIFDKIAKEIGLEGGRKLRVKYNSLKDRHKWDLSKLCKYLEVVIILLNEYPKALVLAEKELESLK